MRSKTIIAGVLSAAISLSVLTACAQNGQNSSGDSSVEESKAASAAEEQSSRAEQSSKAEESSTDKSGDGKMYKLTIRDSGKSNIMTARFINTMSGASEDIPMTKTDEGADYYIVCNVYQPGEHMSVYWQNIFPEFLQAVFERKVSALENGAVVNVPDQVNELLKKYQEETSFVEREPTDKDYVYYDNSETKWDKVCAYWWGPYGASTTNITTNEYYDHKWPGIEMEKMGDTDIYRVVAPGGAVGIIFDNGVGDDEMAEGNEAYQTADLLYSDPACSGKVYKIDKSVAPKQGTGVEKTKYVYPSGKWTAYEP